MFERPEHEKMAFCERHRLLGNFLYGEGVLPKAAEQYKTVSACIASPGLAVPCLPILYSPHCAR